MRKGSWENHQEMGKDKKRKKGGIKRPDGEKT
jgi:hypothetical protein